MNAIVTTNPDTADDLIRVLQNSLYPGAKRESVELVVAYCRLNQLDPMLKPVHIVPQRFKVSTNPDKWETRDTLMPGIGLYRILAARSGEYGGKSEPEFGANRTENISGVEVTFPEWCRVTISRIVQGQARTFTAKELWRENFAARRDGGPNEMWQKRAYGQLAKCAEAQALRMAFPEFSGAAPTAEEMEGKGAWGGPTVEHEAQVGQQGLNQAGLQVGQQQDLRSAYNVAVPMKAAAASVRAERKVDPTVYDTAPARTDEQWQVWLDKLKAACAVLYRRSEVVEVGERATVGDALATGPQWVQREISAILAENYKRFPDEPEAQDEVHIEGEEKLAAG